MENKSLIQEILKSVDIKRSKAENRAYLNVKKCMENSDFSALEYRIRTLAFDIAVKNSKNEDVAKDMENYSSMLTEQNILLEKMGYTRADLSPNYRCKKCNDTGYVTNGLCDCVKNEYSKMIKKTAEFSKITDFKFDDFDLTVYKDDNTRINMQKLYKVCFNYCKEFPNNKKQNLIFLGKTGVGKTCLLSAIANELIERSFTVCYLSAFELNQCFLSYHTADMKDKNAYLESILNCDELIIDDLGTEPILKNVTLEYLFVILNQRNLNNKHTVISSNLTLEDLLYRYGERIFSRITDKNKSEVMLIRSVDLRINK